MADAKKIYFLFINTVLVAYKIKDINVNDDNGKDKYLFL